MAGILASMVTGGAKGGFKATGELADNRIKETMDEKKASVLALREKNMARFRSDLRREEGKLKEDYRQDTLINERDYEKNLYDQRIAKEEKIYNRRLTAEEKKQIATELREQNRYNRSIKEKNDLPSDFKKNYDDIKATRGEEQANAYADKFISSVGGKTIGTKNNYKMQELWSKTFNAALERGEDLDNAQKSADKVLTRFGLLKSEVTPDDTQDKKSSLDQILDNIKALGIPSDVEKSSTGNSTGETPGGLIASHGTTTPGILASNRATFVDKEPVKPIMSDETVVERMMKEGVKGVRKTGEWKGMPIGEKRNKMMIYKNGKWEYMKKEDLKEYKTSIKG